MYEDSSDVMITSAEGPNGVGKGALLSNVRYLLTTISFANYCNGVDTTPLRTAVLTEPPQLPLTYFAHKSGVHDGSCQLLTWRNMLKEGLADDILYAASAFPDSKTQSYAEGFLTARAVVEQYVGNDFNWNIEDVPPPFIDLLPNIVAQYWGNRDFGKLPYTKIVIKDRGTGSTAVFQGEDKKVRDMITQVYENCELSRELLTLVVLPTDPERWVATLASRSDDKDVHDGKYAAQLDKYGQLKAKWEDIFSDNIVVVENDPSGLDINLNEISFLVTLLYLCIAQNREIKWFDLDSQINFLRADMFTTLSLLGRSPISQKFSGLNDLVTARYTAKYMYRDIPLCYYSGNVGLVTSDASFPERVIGLLVANDLKEKVVKIP